MVQGLAQAAWAAGPGERLSPSADPAATRRPREGELAVHVVATVRDGRIATFDAYERGPAGRSDARAHFADR